MLITIKLNENGKKEIQRIKDAFGINENALALEFALLGYSAQKTVVSRFIKRVLELEQEKLELQAIVSYLESKNEEEH